MSESLDNKVKEILDGFGRGRLTAFFDEYFVDDQYVFYNEGIEVKHEDHHGGEGEGEDYWTVYSFKNSTDVVYVKFDGWYRSYDGSNYKEWVFVTPEPKLITVWK